MRALLVLVLASLAFAGCVAKPQAPVPASDDGGAEVAALAHLDAARAEALAWDPAAKLVGVTATEGEPLHDLVDPPLFWNTAADPEVGNGRALVWTYAFAGSNASTLFYVSKAADGATLYARALPLPYYWPEATYVSKESTSEPASDATVRSSPAPYHGAPAELPTPSLDSDAAAAAADAFAPFAEFADLHPRHQVHVILGTDGDRPIWAFLKRTATYFGATVVVDGASGEILHASSWPHPMPPLPPCLDCRPPEPPEPEPRPADEHAAWTDAAPGRFAGGTSPADPARTTFDVASAYWFREARIELTAEVLPGEWLTLTVLDPEGHVLHMESGTVFDVAVTWGLPGTYTIEVRNDGVALRDVPFDAAIDVRYGEPARLDTYSAYGMLAPWSSAVELPFPVDLDAESLVVDVRLANALPTDTVRVRLLGPDGFEEEHVVSGDRFTLEVPTPADGGWRVLVWPETTTVKPLDVAVLATVAYAPWEDCCWM